MELKYGFLAGVLALGLAPAGHCSEVLSIQSFERTTLPMLGKTQFLVEPSSELQETQRPAPARIQLPDEDEVVEHEVRMIGGASFNLTLLSQQQVVSEDQAEATATSAANRQPVRPQTQKRRVLIFKATWCGACQVLHNEWPRLREVNWRVGTDDTQHFQMVDADERPDLMAKYGIASLPTILVVEDEKEVSRHGLLDAHNLAELYYGRLR